MLKDAIQEWESEVTFFGVPKPDLCRQDSVARPESCFLWRLLETDGLALSTGHLLPLSRRCSGGSRKNRSVHSLQRIQVLLSFRHSWIQMQGGLIRKDSSWCLTLILQGSAKPIIRDRKRRYLRSS